MNDKKITKCQNSPMVPIHTLEYNTEQTFLSASGWVVCHAR